MTGESDQKQIVGSAGDLFQHLADYGVAARYVEMGNEFSLPEYASRVADSADYLTDRVHPVAARVRKLHPDARIAASGLFAAPVWVHPSQYAEAVGRLPARQQTWDRGLADYRYHGGIRNFDAVVYHNYRMSGDVLPADGGGDDDHWKRAFLAFPQASMLNAADNARGVFGDDIRVALTEFGFFRSNWSGTDPRNVWLRTHVALNSTWDALHTAGYYLGGVEQGDVYEAVMRHPLSQFVRLRGPDTESYAEINPTCQVLAHLFNVAGQATDMDVLSLPDNPILPVTVMGRDELPVFQAVQFNGPEAVTWVLLNRGNVDRHVALPNAGGYTHRSRWVYRSDAEVVPGGFARLPEGNAPWAEDTPMAVVHDEAELDPKGEVSFWSPKFSLVFVTLSFKNSPGVPAAYAVLSAVEGSAQDWGSIANSLLGEGTGRGGVLAGAGSPSFPVPQAATDCAPAAIDRQLDSETWPALTEHARTGGSAYRRGPWGAETDPEGSWLPAGSSFSLEYDLGSWGQ